MNTRHYIEELKKQGERLQPTSSLQDVVEASAKVNEILAEVIAEMDRELADSEDDGLIYPPGYIKEGADDNE